jgi:DNA modification methylase
MAVKEETITERYCLYNGDCVEVSRALPDDSVDLSIYSPPFAGLYCYSSDPQDMSNCIDHDEFFTHYGFLIDELARLTKPGRITDVHCMDIPLSNSGCDAMFDLPGRIIAEHEQRGFVYAGRRVIWKEPLMVRNRTMMKSLHHKTLCEDAARTSIANADYLLTFRRTGENQVPVTYSHGLVDYHGDEPMPPELVKYRGMTGDQKKNAWSQQIWRRYASSVWMDIRIDNVLAFRDAKDAEDEKHVHPLQLDVIARACELHSNPGEVVLTPFMGVGSEVYGAVRCGRKGIGIELKPSYYQQACRNVPRALEVPKTTEEKARSLFEAVPA